MSKNKDKDRPWYQHDYENFKVSTKVIERESQAKPSVDLAKRLDAAEERIIQRAELKRGRIRARNRDYSESGGGMKVDPE